MKLSDDLKWRNLVNQTTFEDVTALDERSYSFYLGVDPSADSMTIGNLASLITCKRLVQAGHELYLLVGGATGQIGDPDGKKDERVLKDQATIVQNVEGIRRQYEQIMGGPSVTLVNNADWFADINYIDFLREVGKNVPMSQMLGREFIKSRLGEDGTGISYAEFSYVLIQAYDFLHLNREYGVELQLCGADQWGNSISGVDLIRRIDNRTAHVLSIPLVVNKTTGRKFGKSEDGAVWLSPEKTSVYKFYQFWLNVDDVGVEDYLKIYTFLPKEEIEAIVDEQKKNPSKRLGQKTLAHEITKLVHGLKRTESVERVSEVLFSNLEFSALDENDLEELSKEIPTIAPNTTVVEALVSTGLASSKGEARRLIQGGAISLNKQKITEDIAITGTCLIKKGKNSFILAY
ncbi:MAG: tyrosine--tRNA ligase [Candidatus Nanosyncoccaceae bacterium]|jgi:tyrosyl-tRNA synthetase